MLLPGLGEADPPAIVRAGLAIALTVLLVPAIAPLVPPVPVGTAAAAAMVAAEVVTGLWLGWLARMLVMALPIAGQFLSYMLGVSNVLATGSGAGRANHGAGTACSRSPSRWQCSAPASMRCRWPRWPAAID